MKLLAIDSACSFLSVAVSCNQEIFYMETEAGIKQSEIIINFIDSLLKKASLKAADLDGVICMKGPGSFTGLRIGYSIAKGLALSLSIPFTAIPTLDCITWEKINNSGEAAEETVLAVIQAGKNAFFSAFYKNGECVKPVADLHISQIIDEINSINETEKIIITGPAADLIIASLPQKTGARITFDKIKKGYARELISIAKKQKLLDGDVSYNLFSGPEYFRKTDAEISLQKIPE
jgi:tRNA threonylcarbamoyladenosine biosynthesis protein TsaB